MDFGSAIKVVGLDAVIRRLDKAKAEMGKTELAFKRSVAVIDRWVQENFKTEGGKVGGWVPLADSTIESRMRRRNKQGEIRILQDNGNLRRNWKHLFGKDHGGIVSGTDYGIFPQTGTSKMPQRRILPEIKEIWPSIKGLFEDHIRRALQP